MLDDGRIRIRIRTSDLRIRLPVQEAQKHTDPDPDPEHWLIKKSRNSEQCFSCFRLVQYFFLDLAHLLDPEMWMDLVDNLIKFPSAFSLPPSIIKLTQVCHRVFQGCESALI
jgi:hypothetical protein